VTPEASSSAVSRASPPFPSSSSAVSRAHSGPKPILMNYLPSTRVLAQASRPKTLWAAASPVLVGWALAWGDSAFHVLSAGLAMTGALLIQIATNYHNDYADFLKGTDRPDRAGPTRVTAAGLASVEQMRRATVLAFGLAVLSGIYLMVRGGFPIVAIGVLSILFGILYTAGRHSLAYLGIADFFVLLFFGPVAVGGTYWVQALDMSPSVLLAGLAPGLLAMAILLVNNIRDAEEDELAGKRTLVVRLGRKVGVSLYGLCLVASAGVPVVLWLFFSGRPLALLASLILIPGALLVTRIWRGREPEVLNPILGQTALLLLLYSVLFSVGWLIP
jgi:1,4-dihydroxy-2-naphthoate polyprenyltransferase